MTDAVDQVVERKMGQTPALSYGYARRFGVLIEPAGAANDLGVDSATQ